MSVTKKLKWRRALSTLRFSYEELEYVVDSAKAAAPEFESFYRTFCAQNNIDINSLDQQHQERIEKLYGRNEITDNNAPDQPDVDSANDTALVVHKSNPNDKQEEYQMTADEIAIHESFSKLFKQIALKLHPDRVDKSLPNDEQKLRISMFQKVNRAFEDKKYYILLDVAEKYSISTPRNYEQQTRWMKREFEKVSALIAKEKNTYNYAFAEAESTDEKEQVIRKFIYQLFRVNV